MSKKKKKKKSISILEEVDKTLNVTYDSLIEEIQDLQLQLNLADQRAMKKARKKMKKDPNYFKTSKERIEARKEIIEKIEGNNLLERIENMLKDLCPIIVVISRLIASFILGILSIDAIKIRIKPETLKKMTGIYKTVTNIN